MKYYTVKEVAEITNVVEGTVKRWLYAAERDLPGMKLYGIKIGRKWAISQENLDLFIKKQNETK